MKDYDELGGIEDGRDLVLDSAQFIPDRSDFTLVPSLPCSTNRLRARISLHVFLRRIRISPGR
jgi:hypothetical protein